MSGATPSEAAGGWSKRTLRLALLASLAVNLLGVGLIAGSLLAPVPAPTAPVRKGHTEFGLKGFSRTLPPDRAAVLRESFLSRRPEIVALRETARSARNEATEALGAPTYDKPKLRAALESLDAAEVKLRKLASEIVLEAGEKLTPTERQDLVTWWKQRQPRLFMRPEDKGDKPGAEGASTSGATP